MELNCTLQYIHFSKIQGVTVTEKATTVITLTILELKIHDPHQATITVDQLYNGTGSESGLSHLSRAGHLHFSYIFMQSCTTPFAKLIWYIFSLGQVRKILNCMTSDPLVGLVTRINQ